MRAVTERNLRSPRSRTVLRTSGPGSRDVPSGRANGRASASPAPTSHPRNASRARGIAASDEPSRVKAASSRSQARLAAGLARDRQRLPPRAARAPDARNPRRFRRSRRPERCGSAFLPDRRRGQRSRRRLVGRAREGLARAHSCSLFDTGEARLPLFAPDLKRTWAAKRPQPSAPSDAAQPLAQQRPGWRESGAMPASAPRSSRLSTSAVFSITG